MKTGELPFSMLIAASSLALGGSTAVQANSESRNWRRRLLSGVREVLQPTLPLEILPLDWCSTL